MQVLMPDSPLNGAERALQHSFRKSQIFNGLVLFSTLLAAYLPIRALPDLRPKPAAIDLLTYRPVQLPEPAPPLRLAGAWDLDTGDRRFGGLSALAFDHGRFLSVSDRGSVLRFDGPGSANPHIQLSDLRDGPGPFAKKWSRDAESLAPDPQGRGWWVGYEQNHSLWLYPPQFGRSEAHTDLNRADWWNNRGAEGLVADGRGLLVLAENGREAMPVVNGHATRLTLHAGADVADAATAPDG
ncbi:MAG TPA: esterase-like activity of phytase family protein, partial [Sphingomicrobium sp.]|nr:esterase-like activity of phytase family protein [Sphingomicrobium sp.]